MKGYNINEPSSYLAYFDANSLYGWAMSESLPLSNYEWCLPEKLDDILRTEDDANHGYYLEVDLEYPIDLHDMHNDYPLCCERLKPHDSKVEKLILNFNDKEKYVLHFRSLKFAVSHGLKIKKVHKVLRFKQSKWLRPYIELNTIQRQQSKNAFEKSLYKLMSNACFGKCLENVRKRVDIKLVNKWDGRYGAKALISKPNFKSCIMFNENLVAIELQKSKIKLNKPIAVGVAILEISKYLMYEFHYDFMMKNYDYRDCKLLYTDTDSLIYHIKGHNVYSLIKQHKDRFDTSDYTLGNPYDIDLCNKKIPGLMKDENNGRIMTEFVGLRAKMYGLKVENGEEEHIMKRAKGVKKHVLSKKITFDDFLNCLENSCGYCDTQALIKSHLHKVYTIDQHKRMLDPFDDKRLILNDKVNTLAWGHYKIDLSQDDKNE